MALPIGGGFTRHDTGWSLRPIMTIQIDDPGAPADLPKAVCWRPTQDDHESAIRALRRPLFALAEPSAGERDHVSGVTWVELLSILVPDSAERIAALGARLEPTAAARIVLGVLEARTALETAWLEGAA
jgi:hypothetical protein